MLRLRLAVKTAPPRSTCPPCRDATHTACSYTPPLTKSGPHNTTHFFPFPLLNPLDRFKLSLTAISNTSLTPTPALALHSRYRFAPISRATASPSEEEMGFVPWAAIRPSCWGSSRRSVLVQTRMRGTVSQKWAISGYHCGMSEISAVSRRASGGHAGSRQIRRNQSAQLLCP